MKPVRPKTPAKKIGTPRVTKSPSIKDPIEVFCRIRPLSNKNDSVCVQARSSTTVILVPPDNMSSKNGYKEYSFRHVFEDNATQEIVFDQVALPLVKDLLQGTNGLLFTYGITSSGKTYTMTGSPQDGGILPRSFDVLFNSIKDYQALKHVFKSDKRNGFEIQSTSEALLDQQKEQLVYKSRQRKKEFLGEWANRIVDETKIDDVNSNNSFAVFVSYVEVYNEYIYDLFEQSQQELSSLPRLPQPKMLREDKNTRSMFVHGVTEMEVKSADEALELFCKAQQHRRISNTVLNSESSRSHSVFTVRIAQAPLDINGAEVIQDPNLMTVSQLSMVDLAGSERSKRTQNKGLKLNEAGKINNSLMALRTCIQTLWENQMQGNSNPVPYRRSKLTHLFRTFLEGEGRIKMLVCVNPTADDYEETIHVMKFAELTKDVEIHRGTPVPLKRSHIDLYRESIYRAQEVDLNEMQPMIFLHPENLQNLIGNLDLDDEESCNSLVEHLVAFKNRRNAVVQDCKRREELFRQNLAYFEKEHVTLQQKYAVVEMDRNAREQQVRDLENRLSKSEEVVHIQQQKLHTSERTLSQQKIEIQKKETSLKFLEDKLAIKDKEISKLKIRERETLQEKEQAKREADKVYKRQAAIKRLLRGNAEVFEQFKRITELDNWDSSDLSDHTPNPHLKALKPSGSKNTTPVPPRMTRAKSAMSTNSTNSKIVPGSLPQAKSDPNVAAIDSESGSRSTPYRSVAVSNPRHRRSQSSSGDVWLEHNPTGHLELGTVLQPKMKKKKSVSKLEVKDVTKPSVSKYVLTHQEQDSNGELETQLFKGDVIPSAGGGAQVIFNDVEKLRQESPPQQKSLVAYNLRKRSAENMPLKNIEENCAVAVECHGVPSKLRKDK